MGVPNVNGVISQDEVDVALLYCVLVLRQPNNDDDFFFFFCDAILGKSNKEISELDIIKTMF